MGIVFLFVYGLVLGSFFNVVGLRVPLKQSIVSPRSACPTCGHQLKPYELIPVISYLLQGENAAAVSRGFLLSIHFLNF